MKNRVLTILTAVVLTAALGRITYGNHVETWYDLPMNKVIQRSQDAGIPCEYWVDDRGVKMFGQWVIVAAHPSKTRYTTVQTSLGEGIILDFHTTPDTKLYDIATSWGNGGKK